ncbi:MAG: alanine--tRNA ligase [Deltaproteobacteria bacterium]|nr:alanine--tRNA ligase [Deltaproteobacteria bacterium]
MLSGNGIREKFLKYFEGKGHARVASSSLIPFNDPTLFFTNAGMVQFKDVFTGRETRNYRRATSSQKCLRVSGKHNDLENVGVTPRHHTFFEMLGNFSFGDYFKKEAIAFAWEFLTGVVKIPVEPLWASVFKDDDEAYAIWHKQIGVKKERIIRLGEKDNFWAMGDTGPCGPCSEILIDLKWLHEGKAAKGNPATNDDDFMEIWNLVFMQFNRDEKGAMTPLPKPSIDTGMGLERLATVLQKKKSNYDSDLFLPLIAEIGKRTNKSYGTNRSYDISLRVLADHIRAMAFLISDGVQPSNEGRGYVLRRIMRRAIRHSRLLGVNRPILFEIVPVLVKEMGSAYPELAKNQSFITKVIQNEEERFLETLERGLEMMDTEIRTIKAQKGKIFSGEAAFRLTDTFGFPIDLTELIARENHLTVDREIFDREMEKQKGRARAAWKGSGESAVGEVYHQLVQEGKKTRFLGYENLSTVSRVTALMVEGKRVEKGSEGSSVEVFTEASPFYGEGGGQVGDRGVIHSDTCTVEVEDTQKPVEGIISHRGKITAGTLKVGDRVHLEVATGYRRPTMLNHTATHILHAALREILGDHVKQAGSLVEPHRLRFDFSHFEPLTPTQIEEIERRVNEVIQANHPVTKEEMSFKEAQKKGALAFFGDKYGDRVRVVTVGPYSMEFCGGTHLNHSGEIGVFKITGESSVASGIRRIEAVTGMDAFREFQKLEKNVDHLAELLKTTPAELPQRVQKLAEQVKGLEKELSRLKTKMATSGVATSGVASGGGADFMSRVKEVKGVNILAFETDIDDLKTLRDFSDQVKNRLGSGIVLIGSKAGGKVSLIVTVSKDLTGKYKAGDLIRDIAAIVGGKGGGRPDMAQAGGNLPEKLPEAFKKLESLL